MTSLDTPVRQLGTQVVVIGAGPVGLLLGCELARAHVPVVIVERLAAPMTESRASQLTTLTAELLHERGFDALLKEAAAEPRAHFGGLSFDLSGTGSPYAGNWKVPQYRTEAILAERAGRLGVPMLRAHTLTGLSTFEDHVWCEVQGPEGLVRIQARFVVGCDGAQSTVRELGGFATTVTAATKELFRADVTGLDIPDRRFERRPTGFAVASTRGGVTRVMVHAFGQGAPDRAGPPGFAQPRFAEIAHLWRLVTGEDISAGEPIWTDSFGNSTGQADAYRRGRLLLAGDAAHWHMPIGGQALNVGLQDAVNLGWKLAGTVSRWAPPWLLDSYHDERHPIAARVLRYVTAQEMLMLGETGLEPLRTMFAELLGLQQARGHLARVVSGLDDHYRTTELPPAGRRLSRLRLRRGPDSVVTAGELAGADIEPLVLRLSGPGQLSGPDHGDAAATVLPSGFRLRTVEARTEGADQPPAPVILLRPDGYVIWAGADGAALGTAIRGWFTGPSRAATSDKAAS